MRLATPKITKGTMIAINPRDPSEEVRQEDGIGGEVRDESENESLFCQRDFSVQAS